MFKNFFASFWPSFFLFLTVVFAAMAHYRGDLMDRAITFLGWYLMLAGYIILALALIATGVILYLAARQRLNDTNRPVDGAFPLQRHKLKGGRTLIVNPNTMISPAAIVDPRDGYHEWEHPAGWDVVTHIRELVERANMIRAIFPGDRVRMDRNGAMSDTPRPNDATMKMLDLKRQQDSGAGVPYGTGTRVPARRQEDTLSPHHPVTVSPYHALVAPSNSPDPSPPSPTPRSVPSPSATPPPAQSSTIVTKPTPTAGGTAAAKTAAKPTVPKPPSLASSAKVAMSSSPTAAALKISAPSMARPNLSTPAIPTPSSCSYAA